MKARPHDVIDVTAVGDLSPSGALGSSHPEDIEKSEQDSCDDRTQKDNNVGEHSSRCSLTRGKVKTIIGLTGATEDIVTSLGNSNNLLKSRAGRLDN